MTGITFPRNQAALPGRHIDGSSVGDWLSRRLNPTAFVQTMLIVCLVLVIWPAQYGGRFSMTIVAGNSMEPTYNLGDAVVTWREPVSIGDSILFRVPDGQVGEGNPVIHRVVGGDPSGWATQGDNSVSPDDWTPASGDVMGVAKFHVPFGGRVVAIMKSWLFISVLGGIAVGLLFWPDGSEQQQKRRRRGRHLA